MKRLLALAALLLAGLAAGADITVKTPATIVVTNDDVATLGVPRWKMYVGDNLWNEHTTGSASLWVVYATAAGAGTTQLQYSGDSGDTWSSDGVFLFDAGGHLDMHVGIAAADSGLWFGYPDGATGVFTRRLDWPAIATGSLSSQYEIDTESQVQRIGIGVDGNNRVWAFTRLLNTQAENIDFRYSDDGGASWAASAQAVYTQTDEVRFGAMALSDGAMSLFVYHMDSAKGYRYYRWNGSAFAARADSSILAEDMDTDRFFTHNMVDDNMHLIFSYDNGASATLRHYWKPENGGAGSWNYEAILTDNNTVPGDMRPACCVRGDDLYVFYTLTDAGDSGGDTKEVYARVWSQTGEAWGNEIQVSGGGGYHTDPNTAKSVPTNVYEIPVVWTQGTDPYNLRYSALEIDEGFISIPGGNYATPYEITVADTTYKLTGDMTAEGSGIVFHHDADNTLLDFNGYTLTYNTVDDETGNKRIGVYTAGTSIKCPGDVYASAPDGGDGCTDWRITGGTITEFETSAGDSNHAMFLRGADTCDAIVDSMTITIESARTRAIYSNYAQFDVTDCTITDSGFGVRLRSQIHASIEFDNLALQGVQVLRNTIYNARQTGIQVYRNVLMTSPVDSIIVRGNTIYLSGNETNSFGISGGFAYDSDFSHNTIKADGTEVGPGGGLGRGIHLPGTIGNRTHDNIIEVMCTSGTEAGSGVFSSWGIELEDGASDCLVYDNDIISYGDIDPDGDLVMGGGIGILTNAEASGNKIYNNTVYSWMRDGPGDLTLREEFAAPLVFVNYYGGAEIYGNTFTSNQNFVMWLYDMGDSAQSGTIGVADLAANTWILDTGTYPQVSGVPTCTWGWCGEDPLNDGASVWVVLDPTISSNADEFELDIQTTALDYTLRMASSERVGFDGIGSGITITATADVGGLTVEGTSAADDSCTLVLPEWSIITSGTDTTQVFHNNWEITAGVETPYDVTADAVTAYDSSPPTELTAERTGSNAVVNWSGAAADTFFVQLAESGVTLRAYAIADTFATIPIGSGAVDVKVWPIVNDVRGVAARAGIAAE